MSGSSSGLVCPLATNAESSPSSVTRRVRATVSAYGAAPFRTRTVSSVSATFTPSAILAKGRLRVPNRGAIAIPLSTMMRVGFTTMSVTVSAKPAAWPVTNADPSPAAVARPPGETVTAAGLEDDHAMVYPAIGMPRALRTVPV